jgi:ribosomal protein L40E
VPLRKDEVWKINIFALCIWVCYFRSCYVDPGRLPASQQSAKSGPEKNARAARRQRWCRRCEAYKPPRAHHCKTCQRFGLKPIRDLKFADVCIDVSPRWITTAHGHQTACHILPFPTSSASCSTPFLAWAT